MQATTKGSRRPPSARTPLFKSLRRLFGLANLANERNAPPADELVEFPLRTALNRREFLRMTGVAAAAVGAGSWLTGCATPKTGPQAPRIAIVGGGIAGLNAAYKLKQHGYTAAIYEASERSGGRIYTAKALLNPGLTTELGGEFVDSKHEEMLALAREFKLEWLDMQSPSEGNLVREAFYFNGTFYTEVQAVEAFRPLALQIKADYDKLGKVVNFETEGGGGELDKTSLAEYFDKIGAQGWIRQLLEVAFITEYGLECSEQSSLNMIFMISTDLSAGKMELFGESDERYKVVGGNQRIVDELACRVNGQIQLGQKLVAVKARDQGFILVLNQDGRTNEVAVDFVVFTLPFTLLREVDLQMELPAWKKKAIMELGYGMNAKLLLGTKQRLWRDQGQSGNIFSNEPFQLGWDNSRLQGGVAGGFTCFTGGRGSEELKNGTPQAQAQRMLAALDQPFPGMTAQFNGKVERFYWPTHPFTKASYACYRPGQWTSIAGAEGKPVGNLFFAGEHCSYDFQGFMNGGAETGKQAAANLLKALRRWKHTAANA